MNKSNKVSPEDIYEIEQSLVQIWTSADLI